MTFLATHGPGFQPRSGCSLSPQCPRPDNFQAGFCFVKNFFLSSWKKVHSFFVCLFASAHAHAMISSFYIWTDWSMETLNNQAHTTALKSVKVGLYLHLLVSNICVLTDLSLQTKDTVNCFHPSLPPLLSLSLSRSLTLTLVLISFLTKAKIWATQTKAKLLTRKWSTPIQACLGSRLQSIRVYIPPKLRYQPKSQKGLPRQRMPKGQRP